MKKFYLCSTILVLLSLGLTAQVPGIQWEKRYSFGNQAQRIFQIKSTAGRGYILAGMEQVLGSPLLIKTDSVGNIIWKKIQSGYAPGAYESVTKTASNEFVAAGRVFGEYSGSSILGSSFNFLVAKYKDDGTPIWTKVFGGTKDDLAASIIETSDAGYVVAGYTMSTDVSVSGNHGGFDFWITKLSTDGFIQWQKCYGGSGDDKANSIQRTSDGGFIVAGSSISSNGNVTLNKGGQDGWVVKLDNNGNLQWQKSLGGSGNDIFNSVLPTADGGYMFTGSTYSNDGDVSGNHGNADLWIVKLNANGNLQWQKCFGGTGEELGKAMDRTLSNNWIIVGQTKSNDGDVAGLNGGSDTWLIKLTGTGNIMWQKTIGTNANEIGTSVIALSELDFAVSANKESSATEPSEGILYRVGTTLNTIKGTVFLDYNRNASKESNEPFFSNVIVKTEKTSYVRSSIPFNGSFKLDVDTGSFITSASTHNPYYIITPAYISSSFNSYSNKDSISFAVQPVQGKRDLSINLIPVTPSRPGFSTQYKIVYKNTGTDTVANGTVQLIKSSKLNVVSTVPSYNIIKGDTLIWNYSGLKPLDSSGIIVNFSVTAPPTTNNGDRLLSVATILPVATDLTPSDDTSVAMQTVIGSYDPNDKSEIHAGKLTTLQALGKEWLQYIIRFQNTGTDTAFNIVVRDTLSNKLDWKSVQMVTSSHGYQLSIKNENMLTWTFDNIKLVDSVHNEPGSHGYIVYRIKPTSVLVPGDTIKNAAGIYFDFNLPVQTNTEKTTVEGSALPVRLIAFTANRSGKSNLIQWATSLEINADHFEVERSVNGRDYVTVGKVSASGIVDYAFHDDKFEKTINYYRLKMVDKDGRFEYTAIRSVNNTSSFDVSVYPNPVKNTLSLKINSEKRVMLYVRITSLEGKHLLVVRVYAETGTVVKMLDLTSLEAGSYFAEITSPTKEASVTRFEKL